MPRWSKSRHSDKEFVAGAELPEDYGRQVKSWRGELAIALKYAGKKRGTTAMRHLAELFYEDKSCAIGILKHLLPQLKAVDVKIAEGSPFKLILDISQPAGDEDER